MAIFAVLELGLLSHLRTSTFAPKSVSSGVVVLGVGLLRLFPSSAFLYVWVLRLVPSVVQIRNTVCFLCGSGFFLICCAGCALCGSALLV